MAIERDDQHLIFRRLDGSDSDEVIGWGHVEDDEYRDHWWTVDPERGLVFHRTWGPASPQANADERVARIVAPKLYPWAEIVQLPSVRFRAHDDGRVWVNVVEARDPASEECYACMVGVWTGPESHTRGCVAAQAPAPVW